MQRKILVILARIKCQKSLPTDFRVLTEDKQTDRYLVVDLSVRTKGKQAF